jgi:hypothetical protein
MKNLGNAKYEWFKTFLLLPNRIPSHDTFNRVFQALDPRKEAFWTQSVRQAILNEIVAMDGKALRRALTDSKKPSLHRECLGGRQQPGAGPTQSRGKDQLNHCGAAIVTHAGIKRLHRDAGRDGLPKEYRQRNQRGRCRLRARAQKQSGHRESRCQNVS